MASLRPAAVPATRPTITLPPDEPITQEEIERRRALFAQVMERRERIGLIGVVADELLREARADADAFDE
jgi:hypothetical protein